MRHTRHWAGTSEPGAQPSADRAPVDFIWNVRIPMRDGVELSATVYKPKGGRPTPAIFTLTPYIADTYHARALYFAQHGFAFVLVDCRGRGNSAGQFEPLMNDGRDGHDVADWLPAQPWCDGSAAMWGGSYAGFDQWMALKELPPHLRTIVPAAAAHAAADFPLHNNIFSTYVLQWLTFTSGVTRNASLFEDTAFWREKFRELYLSQRPFKELDQVVGNLTTHFQTWLQHPTWDAYWDRLELAAADYDRIDIPILTITGHYDSDQPGALRYYRQHMASASPARDRHYLIIGPWDHPGTRTPAREFDGLQFGPAGMLDLNQLHVEWYRWTLMDGPRPEFLRKRVAYYLMGADEWKYADSLDTIADTTRRLYLHSDGAANTVFHSGTLDEAPPGQSPPDRYTYDPLDLRPAELERDEIPNLLTDQRFALNLFGNGLVYHTPPFPDEIEITGYLKLVAWIALDVPDTDFLITVCEILRDGSSIALTETQLRARYRESFRREKLVVHHVG